MSLREDELAFERLQFRVQNLLELSLRNTIYVAGSAKGNGFNGFCDEPL